MRVRALVVALLLVSAACGGGNSNPNGPSGSGGSGSSGTSSHGTLTAVVDGVAYSGTVGTASNTNGILTVTSNTTDRTRSVNFATAATIGTTSVTGSATSMQVLTSNGTTVTGTWIAVTGLGTGTITITALSSAGASGTFSFNAPPVGAGATGTKVVTNGVFSVTFSEAQAPGFRLQELLGVRGAFLFGHEDLRDDADVRLEPVAAHHAAVGQRHRFRACGPSVHPGR